MGVVNGWEVMGLMNSPAMRAYGCGQLMRSHGVNELSG